MKVSGITLWDGSEELGPSNIEWDGDKIKEVSSAPKDTKQNYSVIPGIIDTHVHLIHYAGAGYVDYLTWPLVTSKYEQVIHGLAHAYKALKVGVTTLRDLAAEELQIGIRNALDIGVLDGPRILVHCPVGMTAGHGDLFTPPTIKDRRPTADGPDECRKLVRYWARMGSDGIKITTSGGVLSTGDKNEWRNYTKEEISTIVDEAHALSMPVAAHCHTEASIEAAIDGGVDSLEHATSITYELAQKAKKKGITVAPTLTILNRIVSGKLPIKEENLVKARNLHKVRTERMKDALRDGPTVVLGTDSGGQIMPFGLQLDEIRAMVNELALTPEQALKGATSLAAKVIRREDKLGKVAAGYAADFVVVKGKPWKNIDELRPENVVAVVCRGKLVAGQLPS
ncbi:MAG: amidohydrolase family protein [Conexivisphaerales archaeon]